MHFNERFDYPVLIFHDGLSQRTRERIVTATPTQRIWSPGLLADCLERSVLFVHATHVHAVS